jgi:uncharacterized YigZ family protein
LKTIRNNIKHEIIIKNSKFIALLYYVQTEAEINQLLKSTKDEYKNATHYCYAYIINEIKRSNDDGEPGGTAGAPILNVLEKNNLTNIICIVIRYFGGIKLGAGGLIRAYGQSVRDALKEASLLDIVKCYDVTFTFNYDNIKKIDSVINGIAVISKDFKDDIKYTIRLKENDFDIIEKLKLFSADILEVKEGYSFE